MEKRYMIHWRFYYLMNKKIQMNSMVQEQGCITTNILLEDHINKIVNTKADLFIIATEINDIY